MTSAARGQTYRERRAVAPLTPWVSSVWVQRVSPDHPPYRHRTLPNGSADVVCRLGAMPRIVGPQTAPRTELLPPGSTIVGVRLRVGAGAAVLGMPMSELVDRDLDGGELWGERSVRLADRLARSPSATAAAGVLEREVMAVLDGAPVPDPVVAEMLRGLHGHKRVGELPRRLRLGERQLNRRCLAATGLAPKPLHRMLRFQRFLALAHARGLTGAGLARLAAEAGYADQSHLSRECARLAGASPRALLRHAEEHCAGAHDHAPSYAPLLATGV